MAIVKANAYGHGLILVARVLEQKVDWFGVTSLEEGLHLRKQGIKLPILVLGYIPLSYLEQAIKEDLSFAVYNRSVIKKAEQIAKNWSKKVKIHLKIETGLNRQGIRVNEVLSFVGLVKKCPSVLLEGVYTHFANIEDTLDPSFAMEQLRSFRQVTKMVESAKMKIPFKHTACSAAIILFPQTHFDMVRLGISLYGLWPSKEVKMAAKENLNLEPVLAWKTKVIQLKQIKKGESVGYGRTWWASRVTKIAVLPVGYFDGYDRKLSNSGRVLVGGKFAPVVGRVCMNMIMVDITKIPNVSLEDEVVLLGRQGKNEITTEELAEKVGTINYEFVSRINLTLPRILI